MARPAQARIDLAALRQNYQLATTLAGSAHTVAVVKADAYGHGAAQVAGCLAAAKAFAVACIEEALALRAQGVSQPILLLEGFFSADEIPLIAEQGFWTVIHSPEQAEQLACASLTKPLPVWLKVDSGMHRLGLAPAQAINVYQQLRASARVSNVVWMTHMACADELDCAYTAQQVACFQAALQNMSVPVSLANSAILLAWPQLRNDWVRPGLMLYGVSPLLTPLPKAAALQPAMTLRSAIIALRTIAEGEAVGYGAAFIADRPMRVATVALGYADGYPRHAPTGTPVLVNGQHSRLIGRVSMDMCCVDVTDIDTAAIGSEVIFWGQGLPVEEVARHCQTIPYTLLTGVTQRVPRIYLP